MSDLAFNVTGAFVIAAHIAVIVYLIAGIVRPSAR